MTRWLPLLIILALAGCRGPSETAHADEHAEETHEEGIVLTREAAKIAGIEIGEASMRPMQEEIEVPGTVVSTSQGRAVVTPPVAGKVVQIHVRIGQRVEAGQAIVTLRSADLAQSSAAIIEAQRGILAAQAIEREAKAEVDLAKARRRTAEAALARQRAFAKTGAFSQPALQAAQRELADAEAERDRGRQDQTVHQAQLERAETLYRQELISRTELEQARLEVATDQIRQRNAERRIELAKASHDREQKIAAQNLANSREIQTAEAEVRAAALAVSQAEIRRTSAIAAVAGARKGLDAARLAYHAQAGGQGSGGDVVTVAAPIGGVVNDLRVDLGQAVERTTQVCEIENLRTVWVVAHMPEKEIAKAKKGARARITIGALPNRTFHGIVQSVGNRLDPQTRATPVQIVVENADGALRAEMFATVALGVGRAGPALAAPKSALVAIGDRRVVYVLQEEGDELHFEERAVETGRAQGDHVEITRGLDPGERLAVKGGFVLKSEKIKSELKGHEH